MSKRIMYGKLLWNNLLKLKTGHLSSIVHVDDLSALHYSTWFGVAPAWIVAGTCPLVLRRLDNVCILCLTSDSCSLNIPLKNLKWKTCHFDKIPIIPPSKMLLIYFNR